MRIQTLPGFLASFLTLALCAGMQAHGAKLPSGSGKKDAGSSYSYTYNSLAFDTADKKQSYWKVDVQLHNASTKPVLQEGMRYSLLHQQDTLLSDLKPSFKNVLPGQTARLETILALPNKVLKGLPKGTLKDHDAEFTLIGDAYLEGRHGKVHIPQAVRQTIRVDMPKQMAKARRMYFRNLFSA